MDRPLRVSFDIGGVMSKYPHIFRPMMKALAKGGAEVFVLTDMRNRPQVEKWLKENGFEVPSDHVLLADYDSYGESCKEALVVEYEIDLHIDDFPGYCAHKSCVTLFVWPNPDEPYYHDEWKTDGREDGFGRRKGKRGSDAT